MPSKPSSKVPRSSAKKIKPSSTASRNDMNIEALVNEQLNMGATAHSGKRKGHDSVHNSDLSDVEVLESPATPVKKRMRKIPPPPNSGAFKLLDAVSISPKLGEASQSNAHGSTSAIEFGSVKIDVDARPKRVVVKSEKAKAFDAIVKLPARRTVTKAPVELTPAIAEVPSSAEMEIVHLSDNELPEIDHVYSDILQVKNKGKNKDSSSSTTHENKSVLPAEPVGLWGEVELAMAVQSKSTVTRPSEMVDEDDASSDSDVQSIHTMSDVQSVHISNSGDDDLLNVMSPSCQDPLLAVTYRDLPKIPRLCEVRSFGQCTESLRTPFGATCANMNKNDIRAFLRALLFVKSGQYINTARAEPALLIVENSRLQVRDKNSLAICIMMGTLTESFVIESCEAGPRHALYPIHKVTIAPLEQEWRRDVSVWGMLFNFHVISGMLSEMGFGFATCGEGKGDGWKAASAPSSPMKHRATSSVLMAVSSHSISHNADLLYTASRSFDDSIPLYDGRARKGREAFMFTDADFANLSSWPLYRKSQNDIPADSIVSVGYTLSSYKGSSGPVLSSNIQFVIVISTPML